MSKDTACSIFLVCYIPSVAWEVEYTDEFESWWACLAESAQEDVAVVVTLLEQKGPALPFPYSSQLRGARSGHLRELRVQHAGRPLRVLYAFDPRRSAILLLGGHKTGRDRWYEIFVPRAEALYARHLAALRQEGSITDE